MTREYFENARYAAHFDNSNNQSGLNGGEIILAQATPNNGWRARYGVTPSIGRQLEQRNDQINDEMRHVGPQGQWRPDPRRLRDWRDPFDDPYMNDTINGLRRNGIPKVFSPQRPYPGYGNPSSYGNGYGYDTQQPGANGYATPRPFFGDYGYQW
jgi:hypothetical protein